MILENLNLLLEENMSTPKEWEEWRTSNEQIGEKGEEIYARIAREIEISFRGCWVGIKVESGEYVIGKTDLEALQNFKKKFGEVRGYLRGIGEVHVHV